MVVSNKKVFRGRAMLVNALLFQTVWVFAIFDVWPLMLVPLFAILSHYFLTSVNFEEDFVIFFFVFLAGVFGDTFLLQMGVYQFPGYMTPYEVETVTVSSVLTAIKSGIAPDWLIVLWAAFATTINRSLTMLFNSARVAIIGLSIIGPLAYIAGRECGAIMFADANLIFIAVMWLAMSCMCLFLFNCYEGDEDLEEWSAEIEACHRSHLNGYKKEKAAPSLGYRKPVKKSYVRV